MAEQAGYRVREWGVEPRWERFPIPTAERGEVLIEVEACGVGLTVLNCINGDLGDDPRLLPRVPGHELAGRVAEVGDGVDPTLVGRRVVAYFYLCCGHCESCRLGREQRCPNLAGFVGVHRDGGYAPWTVLPEVNVIPVPEELDSLAATVVPDAVATPVHIADRAESVPGDRVVVLGAGGGVGMHMIQVARHRGALVAGLDITEPKLAAIERLGALPVRSEDVGELDPDLFGGDRPTVVIDLLGTPATATWALSALGVGGRLVALTTFPGRPAIFEARDLVFRELAILGSRYSHRAQVVEAARLVSEGEVVPIIGEVTGPDGIPALHQKIRSGQLVGRGALDWRMS
ncbi:MAG TPA: alcohol dehydrogenase catalytic domain-containing protein [Acidimicrobiia bacterium]|nr:alcohol dehydrogenase catalytic domain-containing protein [Acidimicrobiia bacterium]